MLTRDLIVKVLSPGYSIESHAYADKITAEIKAYERSPRGQLDRAKSVLRQCRDRLGDDDSLRWMINDVLGDKQI